jgi:hypothetical protein
MKIGKGLWIKALFRLLRTCEIIAFVVGFNQTAVHSAVQFVSIKRTKGNPYETTNVRQSGPG